MVKRLLPIFSITLLFSTLVSCSGCSTSKRAVGRSEDLPFPRPTSSSITSEALWQHQLEGKLTDLSVSRSSGHTLISEVLESASENRSQLSLFEPSGKRAWKIRISAPIRAQTISSKADWIVLSTYQEELIRVDSRTGKILWRTPDTRMCRPSVLEKTNRILCYHDDDASPGLVFEIFDQDGKKVSEQKAPQDSLLLKVSADEERVLIAFVKGRVWMLGADLKKIWEKQLPGEIVDAAVASPTESGQFIDSAILLNRSLSGQILYTLAELGKNTQEVKQHVPLQQVEISENGKRISVYGNGPRGQVIAQYDTEPNLLERWSYHSPKYADYNLKMDMASSFTMLGFENISDRTRFSHVIALDHNGLMQWHLPLQAEEGAYLYARGMSKALGLLVIGTDDGVISAYPLKIP
ncbi:MAG: PQQ-binding-like beta-propeller repeat protein [Bdellovibrionales bacterium]|nr:PQQ-binding-like beta-propeller repeat protein [Bdellovibrionales bacterium]